MASVADMLEAKFDRADEHIETLKGMVSAHFDNNVDGMRADVTPQSQRAVQLHLRNEASAKDLAKQAAVLGDIVHNLRSGLDHLAWELVKANGQEPTKDTNFPILKVAPTADRHGKTPPPHIAGGVEGAAMKFIEAVQPYRHPVDHRLEPLLWLHTLWNEDKHRSLLITTTNLQNVAVAVSQTSYRQVFPGAMRLIEKRDDRAELGFFPDDTRMQMQVQVQMLIGLVLPASITGAPNAQPVLEVLAKITARVRGVFAQLRGFLPLPPEDRPYPEALYRH